MNEYKYIDTEELKAAMDREDTQIIDVRDVNAYNGWTMKGEKTGGHVTGARSLPVKWTKYLDPKGYRRNNASSFTDMMKMNGSLKHICSIKPVMKNCRYIRIF